MTDRSEPIDWRRFSEAAQYAQTLNPSALAGYLTGLAAGEPALHDAVTDYLHRVDRARSFMQTAAPAGAEAPALLAPGTRVGVWRIVQVVGAGGMGEVYRAERDDGLYQHAVALKVMKSGEQTRWTQFQQERQRLARLDHPGISRIIDGGSLEDGRPYMAMELVDGQPIDAYADAERLSLPDRLRKFTELCDAISYVHSKLILHRDIKASNVLIDADGKVRLIDFGVATLMDEETERDGPLTIAYAAPEQLQRSPPAVAMDIFSLGMLLHKLIGGALPERNSDGSVVVDPERLRNQDLQAIVAKATALNGDARYPSAASLGEDIRALLAHRPVSARSGGALYQAGKLLRRYPLQSALATAFLLALVAGLGVSVHLADRAAAEASRARAALQRSEFALDRANRWLNTQSAYADALQRLFGGDADIERQTRVLLDLWREAHNQPDKSADAAEHASLLGYSIGRHFLFRNDYPTALEILEGWLAQSYGEPDVIVLGKHLLAIAYMNTGRAEEAAPLLRAVETWYASGFDAQTADHIAAATQLASATHQEADIQRAEALLMLGLAHETDDLTRAYFHNQLSAMRQLRRDFDGAYDALVQLDGFLREHPLTEISGRDTGRLNLAYFEIFHRRDPGRARALATAVLDNGRRARGDNREVGRAMLVLSLADAMTGKFARAEKHLLEAKPILARYAGTDSDEYIDAVAMEIELLADQGRFPQAATRAAAARSAYSDRAAQGYARQRLLLAELHVVNLESGSSAATARCAELALAPDTLAGHVSLRFYRNRLTQTGVSLDACTTL